MVIILLISNVIIISAITGSIGNSKMILYPEVDGKSITKIEKSILTKNLNDGAVNVTLKIAEDGGDFLELIDEKFVLEAGEEKKAKFFVLVKKEGKYNGKINVFFDDLEGDSPGVVLTSTIIVVAKKAGDYSEEDNKEVNENNNTDEGKGVSVITGGAVYSDNKKSISGKDILIGSSIMLLLVLGALLFFMIKKNSVKKSGGINGKKRKKK